MPAVAPQPRVTGAYLQPLLDAALERGVCPSDLAHAAAVPVARLAPLPGSLPAQDYVRLLDAGALLARDPHFGLHVGERVRPGTYSAYGLVLLACRDVGQALDQTMRYEQLAHDLGRSNLSRDGAHAQYEWTSHFPHASRHLAESVFAGIRVFGNWLAGATLPPAQVAFAHQLDTDASEYERVFGALPRFGAPANTARFDAALLGLPVANADLALYPVLRQNAERLLAERAQHGCGIVARVREAIVRNLADEPARLATVAQELELTPRTLQRKLAEAGANFQQVLDETRFALARDYLRRGDLPLADIAFLLGYQEQSAFTHAFKEWSGLNPGAWREREARATLSAA
jgi:AraC-like DNA-binding protein